MALLLSRGGAYHARMQGLRCHGQKIHAQRGNSPGVIPRSAWTKACGVLHCFGYGLTHRRFLYMCSGNRGKGAPCNRTDASSSHCSPPCCSAPRADRRERGRRHRAGHRRRVGEKIAEPDREPHQCAPPEQQGLRHRPGTRPALHGQCPAGHITPNWQCVQVAAPYDPCAFCPQRSKNSTSSSGLRGPAPNWPRG